MPTYGYFVLTAIYLPKNDKYVVSGFRTVADYIAAINEIIDRTHTSPDDWKFHTDIEC